MIGFILFGASVGCFMGFLAGLMIALFSRDGVWPGVWAGLMLVSSAAGAILGILQGVMT